MITIVIISENEREVQILKMAFEQQGSKVVLSKPTYQNYVMIMQYIPDIILIELPRSCADQLSFTRRIRSYKRTRTLPIVGYGNATDQSIVRGMSSQGITMYIERPLKFTKLLRIFEQLLKPLNKAMAVKRDLSEKEKERILILDEKTSPAEKLELMCNHVSKLLAFPFTVARVLQITNDRNSGADHLARAITADPTISTHLLKVSNSVFFASSNRRISSIKDAIIRIGFQETKRIVMGMGVINLFNKAGENLGFDRVSFWYHSLVVALIAERLAKSFSVINTESAFLSGLLHDFGILLYEEFFPEMFEKNLQKTAQEAEMFIDSEKKLFKITHLDLIAELFPRWKIPQEITDAVTGQYTIAEKNKPPDTPGELLAACVAVGNNVAKLLHIGRECDEFVTPLSDAFFKSVKLPHGISADLTGFVSSQVNIYQSFLGLEKRDFTCDCPQGINPEQVHIAVCNPDNALFCPPVIDLSARSVHYDILMPEKLSESGSGKYHAIIWWAVNPVEPETLKPITTLKQAPLGQKKTSNDAAPVILFSPEDNLSERYPDCITIKNSFDTRQFESKLGEILLQAVHTPGQKPEAEVT